MRIEKQRQASLNNKGDFSTLPLVWIERLNQNCHSRLYRKGQILFYEDDFANCLYFVTSGKVKLFKLAQEGRLFITHLAQAGELMGCQALFSQQRYSITAQILEDALITTIDHMTVQMLMKECPEFNLILLRKLSQDLIAVEDKLTDLAYGSTQERLIALLISLQEKYGELQSDNSIKLNFSMSREELASLMGTSVETLVRLLSRLREKGIISAGRNGPITILEPHDLLLMLPNT